MFASDQYELLDFGAGRKLERFGPYVLDRPAPAAGQRAPRDASLWTTAAARYDRGDGESGCWSCAAPIEDSWYLHHGSLALEVKLTEFGHLGVFAEQVENWRWIAERVRAAEEPVNVLNLFAYTGASTLAAAAAGARVTHVDAAANVVDWARRNARASGMIDAPIRWIAEDALKFTRRELKRGNHYDAIILDPPAYGHGPHGEIWKLADQLGELLGLCLELSAPRRQFLLLTCHSGELGDAAGLLKYTLSQCPQLRDEGALATGEMAIESRSGGRLHAGAAVRWTAGRQANPSASRGAARSSSAARKT